MNTQSKHKVRNKLLGGKKIKMIISGVVFRGLKKYGNPSSLKGVKTIIIKNVF
jgi:hypothetical protein